MILTRHNLPITSFLTKGDFFHISGTHTWALVFILGVAHLLQYPFFMPN